MQSLQNHVYSPFCERLEATEWSLSTCSTVPWCFIYSPNEVYITMPILCQVRCASTFCIFRSLFPLPPHPTPDTALLVVPDSLGPVSAEKSCLNGVGISSGVYGPCWFKPFTCWVVLRKQKYLHFSNLEKAEVVKRHAGGRQGLLTLKHRETHGCVVITVATDALVLKHQAISIHNAD